MDALTPDVRMPFDARIRVKLIAACGLDYELGYDGKLPWQGDHAGDTDFFRDETMSAPVIMGRRTWESFPSDRVDDRDFVVLSETMDTDCEDICVSRSWEWAIREAVGSADARRSDIYIAGGESVYRQALDMGIVDDLILTVFGDSYEADTYFPDDCLMDFEIDSYRLISDNKPSYPPDSYRAYMHRPRTWQSRDRIWQKKSDRINEYDM